MRELVRKSLPDRLESGRVLVAKRRALDVPGVPESATSAWWKPHEDHECIDEVRIITVPRWKTSDMSGDEWRVSALTQLLCKGMLIAEAGSANVRTAALALAWLLETLGECASDEKAEERYRRALDRLDGELCSQPGCSKEAMRVYRILTEYSREGFSRVVDANKYLLRAFCDDHASRGDCGLEDADVNYVELESPTAKRVAKRTWIG
jgi:hypothetical protein